VRSGAITPGEAANVQLAKYSAIAAGAKAVGDVMTGIAEIKAEEELSSSVSMYRSAMIGLGDDIDSIPDEIDEMGLPTYDADKTSNMAAEARSSIVSAIRGNIKSAIARRRFDAAMAVDKPQQEESYQIKTTGRAVEALKARADDTITKLVNKGQTDLALEYLMDNVAIYGAAGYTTKKAEIEKGRSTYRLDRAMESQTITVNELDVMLDSLNDNKWPDGEMLLTSQEKYMYTSKVLAKMKGLEEEPGLEDEKQSADTFDELLPGVLDGRMGVEDLPVYRDMLGKKYDKLLGYAITARTRPVKSSPGVVKMYDEQSAQLVLGYPVDQMGMVNWEDKIEEYTHAMSMDGAITTADYERIKNKLEGAVTNLKNNPELGRMLDVEYGKLTGHTVAQSILGTVPKDKTAEIAGSRLILDYYREVSRLGPKDVVDGTNCWMKDKIPSSHTGVPDAILKEYGLDGMPLDASGKVDFLKLELLMLEKSIAKKLRQAKTSGDPIRTVNGEDALMAEDENEAVNDARVSFGVLKALVEAG